MKAHRGPERMVAHDITGDYEARDIWRTTASSPQMVLEEMMRRVSNEGPVGGRSEFCPVVQGDVPHQKRLFVSRQERSRVYRGAV